MKTTDEIFESMKAAYAEAGGDVITDDCDMAIRMYAAAAEIESLYAYNDWIKRQSFPQTADGEFLDRHGEMRGITRCEATFAEGAIRFSVSEARGTDIAIPEGTACMTASGLCFRTTEAGTIPAGALYADIPARAAVAGRGGNVLAGTVVYMVEAPVGVEACINPEAFSGGAEAESDGELRERILKSYKSLPNGVNRAYYEKAAESVDGVGTVTVMPKNRGLGTVDVMITAKDGLPDDDLISAVTDALNDVREICVDILVTAPESVTVDVAVAVDVEDGFDGEEVRERAAEAVAAYFDGTLLGKEITRAKLGSIIYGVDGVKNYVITVPAADMIPGENVLPVAGTVTIGDWS